MITGTLLITESDHGQDDKTTRSPFARSSSGRECRGTWSEERAAAVAEAHVSRALLGPFLGCSACVLSSDFVLSASMPDARPQGSPCGRGPAQPFIGQLHPLQTDYVPVPGPGFPCELAAVGSTHFLSRRTRPCFLAGCWPGPVHRLQRWLPPTSCSQHSCSLSSRRTAGGVCHLPSSAFEGLGLHRTHLDNLCVLRSPDLGLNVCKIPSQTYPNESLSA